MAIEKIHCNTCNRINDCEIIFRKIVIDEEEDVGVWLEDTFDVVRYMGCKSIFFRKASVFSEHIEPDGNLRAEEELYPPKIVRRPPRFLSQWVFGASANCNDRALENLFREIYIALNNNALSLAAMGMRALLEGIIVKSVGDHGSFSNNLDAFEKEGIISKKQKEMLSKVLELGHAVMHRKYNPSFKELGLSLDVVESLYEIVFLGDIRAENATKRIPKREKRA